MTTRIETRFAELKKQGRKGLVTFISAGDPVKEVSQQILNGLPAAGADFIELGMPFTDPMADGPAIQDSSLRALKSGANMKQTLQLVEDFRTTDNETPIILMGYYNPIHCYGVDRFLVDAKKAGVDGLIVVDLPPEEDAELCEPSLEAGVNFIRLATPTSDEKRLPALVNNASGFIYYVSIAGITGTASAQSQDIAAAMARIRNFTDLPLAVGFGISTPDNVAEMAEHADAVVVGSAIVKRIEANLDAEGNATDKLVPEVLSFVKELAAPLHK